MATETITFTKCWCDICKHGWLPRKETGNLKDLKCPKCGSKKWNHKGEDY